MDLIKIKTFNTERQVKKNKSPNYKLGEKCANMLLTNGLVSGYLKNL